MPLIRQFCAAALALSVARLSAEGALLRRHPMPSASLVDRAGEGRDNTAICAAGEKTEFAYSGCVKTSKLYEELKYTGARQVTVTDCFVFCKDKPGKQYFGVTNGKQCWCAGLHEGQRVDASSCDSPCAGNKKQKCGGILAASVFVMFDCTPPTDKEKKDMAAETGETLQKSYATLAHQSCGQAAENKAKVNGDATMVGSVDECKVACSKGMNSMECHGFTFDEDLSKCTFHYDVLDGEVKHDSKVQCFFKKLGL